MTREEKIIKKKARSIRRGLKNRERNKYRWQRNGRRYRGNGGLDCPFDVDMNGMYGTCNCNHENYNSCLGDI